MKKVIDFSKVWIRDVKEEEVQVGTIFDFGLEDQVEIIYLEGNRAIFKYKDIEIDYIFKDIWDLISYSEDFTEQYKEFIKANNVKVEK